MIELTRHIIETQPILSVFLAIGLGYLVGQINIAGFSLGVGGVLFVGLAIGAFAPKAQIVGPIGLIGLVMFLYGIGILYGRQFFEGMMSAAGRKYNLLALVGCVAALLIALPYVLYQMWAFVAPGLYHHEKRLALPVIFSSVLFFAIGMAFAYFIVFPIAFGFFAGYAPAGVQMMTDIDKYLSFVLTMFIAFGVTFEVPVVVVVLVRLSHADTVQTSPGIAASIGIPEPTVAKVLKTGKTALDSLAAKLD